jgi:hypothetical protein
VKVAAPRLIHNPRRPADLRRRLMRAYQFSDWQGITWTAKRLIEQRNFKRRNAHA